ATAEAAGALPAVGAEAVGMEASAQPARASDARVRRRARTMLWNPKAATTRQGEADTQLGLATTWLSPPRRATGAFRRRRHRSCTTGKRGAPSAGEKSSKYSCADSCPRIARTP